MAQQLSQQEKEAGVKIQTLESQQESYQAEISKLKLQLAEEKKTGGAKIENSSRRGK